MTTLLEIKSSVLRQVQACPTFRRRAEGEPAATSADPPEPAAGAWWVLRAQACTVARPRGSWESGARRGRRAGSPDVWTRGTPSRRKAGSWSWAGGGCVPGARVSGLASPCRKPGDGVEFFAHMRLILKKGEGRQGLPCPEVLLHSGSPAPAEPVDPSRGLRALTQEEVEMLYEEALYTVLYRAGTMGPDQVDDQETLLGYLQQVFGTSPEEHAEAIERVKKAKAPTYALKVSVMRAKNLLAKDPNGFSDPYCMLGILPASGAPREPGPRTEQRFSFRKGSKRGGPLPAKCIQVTEVKSSTLNPVWKENFVFEIEDVSTDQLHLDIWDHDDDVSLVEACRKLNEVIGLKGMSRYFKQIVKSARANGTAGPAEDHTDDFLGCLNIPVREVPVAGEDRWFKLEPRSSASRVQGDCQLVLKLITTQRDTGMSQRGRAGFLSYMLLLSRLLQFEHRSEEPKASCWRGELSGPAATILCLHGAQNNLSALQLAVLHWQVSSRHHQTRTLDYGYLLGLLEDMQAHWEASSLPQEQEESLADSFNAFSEFGLRLLRQLRDFFPATNSTAVYRLELLLKCLSKTQTFQPSFEVCSFRTELNADISAALKRGNREWYDRLLNTKSPREQSGPQRLAGLVELADTVYEDLQSCYGIYASLFHSITDIDFFTLTFRQLERLVAEEAWVLTEELSPKMTLEVASGLFELYVTLADIQRFWSSIPGRWVPCPNLSRSPHLPCLSPPTVGLPDLHPLPPVPQPPLGGLWDSPRALGGRLSRVSPWAGTLGRAGSRCRIPGELPLASCHSDSRSLALAGIHGPFLPAVKLWLQVLRDQVRWRLQGAVDVDTLEPMDTSSKHSSSAATASLCFSHIQELWARLAWPDPAQAEALGTQLSQDLCAATLFYTELLRKKVDAQPGAAGEAVSEPLCVVLNNVELLRKAAGQTLRGLAWPEVTSGPEGVLPRPLLGCAQALDEDLQQEVHTVTAHLTSKMVADIRKYVQHISLSPDSIQNDEAVAPLMKYLDEKLALLNTSLVKENLSRYSLGRLGRGGAWGPFMGTATGTECPCRVLEALWELLLQAILRALGANLDVSADFYGRFHFTLEALVSFFHAEGQGLPLESLKDGSYKRLEEELRLHQCSTRECIEQYYLDKLKQRSLEQKRFGRLSVRCHYEAAEQRLVVEVLHAADLPPLDANGLSDPFVIVELGPPHLFPLVRSQRTQVKNRTLHPVYDELFYFSVPAEACRCRGACVLFTVMDHDWLSTNDFAGEAALGLGGVGGIARPQVGGSARARQPVTLHLRRPRAQVKSALRMLEGRTNKEAQEFVKRLKELEKCMEADP
ncbi:BAI1-associated protein 3 isoform X3 [Acinonyx jubatus]|uniref:BAI1-associated protein 3 isoform X3 n=1 Tax=Acinonyx jubatus TaxID=32536 RepID=A0ABM3PDG4_ACIJB|nr:BAI1-associated protein 3 isoform X3 [Acinonyx jubatus]